MNISYVVGICVKNDAISASVLNEIGWLSELDRYNVKLYTHHCDFSDVPHVVSPAAQAIIFDDHFRSSDIVVYHYGIYTTLMDSIFLAPLSAKKIIVFHNITPTKVVPEDHHELIEKSFAQLGHFHFADKLACDSQVNADVLREHGLSGDHDVLPLALSLNLSAPERKPSRSDGVIRIAYIGRFVRSKGTLELINAVRKIAADQMAQKIELTLIGNSMFSDPDVLAEAKRQETNLEIAGTNLDLKLKLDATASEKKNVLERADLFCLPSYHEGFCVPVIEALAAGCRVITYDNSNLAFISGSLGYLVPTGDQDALCTRISSVIKTVGSEVENEMTYNEYVKRTKSYAKLYSPDVAKTRFLGFIESLAAG